MNKKYYILYKEGTQLPELFHSIAAVKIEIMNRDNFYSIGDLYEVDSEKDEDIIMGCHNYFKLTEEEKKELCEKIVNRGNYINWMALDYN